MPGLLSLVRRTREAARLRKRFQLVKERLYAMGRERGLLSDGSVK